MKTTVFFFGIFLSLQGFASNHDDHQQPAAPAQNNCDRLLNPTSEQLNNCFSRFGRSPYRLDLERRAGAADQAERDADEQVLSERSLLVSKTFTRAELDEAFFGQRVIMTKVDRRDRDEATFDADRVCRYLGFVKATDVVVPGIHGEVWSTDTESIRGIVLDHSLNFKPYKKGFLEREHLVKPLERITCFRTIDGSHTPYQHLPSFVIIVNDQLNRAPNHGNTNVNDRPRNTVEDDGRYGDFTSGITSGAAATIER